MSLFIYLFKIAKRWWTRRAVRAHENIDTTLPSHRHREHNQPSCEQQSFARLVDHIDEISRVSFDIIWQNILGQIDHDMWRQVESNERRADRFQDIVIVCGHRRCDDEQWGWGWLVRFVVGPTEQQAVSSFTRLGHHIGLGSHQHHRWSRLVLVVDHAVQLFAQQELASSLAWWRRWQECRAVGLDRIDSAIW